MKTYAVMAPMSGHFYVEVDAETEEEAKELAMLENPLDENSKAEIEEIEYLDYVVKGNVFYGTLNEIYVEEI